MPHRPFLPVGGRISALVLGAAVALAGCSSEEEPTAAPDTSSSPTESSSPSPTASPAAPEQPEETQAAPVSCEELLPASDVAALAGQPLDGPVVAPVAGLPTCQWGPWEGVRVQAATVPAESWGRQLPAILDQVEAGRLSNDKRWLGKLEAAREVLDAGVDGREACEIFGLLLEIQGEPAGSSRVVVFVPTREDPQAVSAQACTGDTYASVLLVAPDLGGTPAEARRVSATLDTVLAAGTRD